MPVMFCEWRRNYPREHPAGPRLAFGSLIVSERAGFRPWRGAGLIDARLSDIDLRGD
jgi:hypothetical protein